MFYVYVHKESDQKYIFRERDDALYRRHLGAKLSKIYSIHAFEKLKDAEIFVGKGHGTIKEPEYE